MRKQMRRIPFGGPQEAVAMLNRNLDLDITKYASVNFNSLADIIDILGGGGSRADQ